MTNLLSYSALFILFLQFTFGAINYSSINRVFLNMYKGIFEASVITIDENGEQTDPYFDEETLEKYVSAYLNENISKYSKDYSAYISYSSGEYNDICLNHHCEKTTISLNAKINVFFHYENARTYYITSKGGINEH